VRAAISISNNGGNWKPWSTYNSGAYRQFLARGSYNIDQTQLALVHAGERVVPAAENFQMSGRYQPGGGGPTIGNVTLVFNQGAILIQASSTVSGSGLDMEKAANELVDHLAKKDVLANLRSR
jgi:hypothetical protein